jgi:hypothetical protein
MLMRVLLVWVGTLLFASRYPVQAQRMSCEEMEKFLHDARIIRMRESPKGVTHPKRATLQSGDLTHDATVQTIDKKYSSLPTSHSTVLNVRDYWGYNIAGYELAKLLSLNMVPPYVDRRIEETRGSFGWWIPDVMMDAADRAQRKLEPPDSTRWNEEISVIRVFDQLICNVDDNLTNFLITKDWHLWMIDFSRAFLPRKTLRKPGDLMRCDRKLLSNLRQLDQTMLEEKLRPYLTRSDIEALLARRDQIVKFFDDQIERKGEAEVLFDLDRVGEPCGTGL